jgi:hypothetical protein
MTTPRLLHDSVDTKCDYCNWPDRYTGRKSPCACDNGLSISFLPLHDQHICKTDHKNDALSSSHDTTSRLMSRMDHGYHASVRMPIFKPGYDFGLHSLTECRR